MDSSQYDDFKGLNNLYKKKFEIPVDNSDETLKNHKMDDQYMFRVFGETYRTNLSFKDKTDFYDQQKPEESVMDL